MWSIRGSGVAVSRNPRKVHINGTAHMTYVLDPPWQQGHDHMTLWGSNGKGSLTVAVVGV